MTRSPFVLSAIATGLKDASSQRFQSSLSQQPSACTVSFEYDKEVVDLHDSDKTIMFHAKDASDLLDGGKREAFVDEEGDEGHVLGSLALAVKMVNLSFL
ncbi:hypothetical protein ACSQ67_025065 [Phaseolus vulgaris]